MALCGTARSAPTGATALQPVELYHGQSCTDRAQNIVIYNCVFRDQGLYTHVGGDIDCHGLQSPAGAMTSGFWNSRFYHNQGDGIQVTGTAPQPDQHPRRAPAVCRRNIFYENLQTGFWIKDGQDMVVSQNEMYGHTNGGGSAAVNTGGQYGFNNVWWIFKQGPRWHRGHSFCQRQRIVGPPSICMIGNVVYNHTDGAINCGREVMYTLSITPY